MGGSALTPNRVVQARKVEEGRTESPMKSRGIRDSPELRSSQPGWQPWGSSAVTHQHVFMDPMESGGDRALERGKTDRRQGHCFPSRTWPWLSGAQKATSASVKPCKAASGRLLGNPLPAAKAPLPWSPDIWLQHHAQCISCSYVIVVQSLRTG